MRTTQLRSFYAVARYGSVTAAADALHVSQPTVTSQVRSLEQNYTVELFHRRGRTLSLTAAGKTLYSIAQRIVHDEKEAIDFLQDVRGLRAGQLKIGAVGPYHVMEIVSIFNESYPGIKINIKIGNSKKCIYDLLNYHTDVAILAQQFPDQRLHSILFRKHPLIAIVPITHELSYYKSVSLKKLGQTSLITRESGSTTRKIIEDAFAREHITPTVAMEVGSREAVREAVILGLGIGIVSEKEHIEDPRIRKLAISDEKIYTYAHVVCLTERLHARLIKAFFEVVDKLR